MSLTAADKPRISRHGFTLVEVLVAIALLLALAVAILPPVLRVVDERLFDVTGEIATDQLMLARAHAQATGRPVEVLYLGEDDTVHARLFAPAMPAFESDDETLLVIPEPWADRALPGGLRLTTRAALDVPPGASGPDIEALLATDAGIEPDPPVIRLAVFLGDGSTLVGRPVWLVDDDGRRGRLSVNPHTGLPTFERSADEVLEEEPLDEEPALDEPDDPFPPLTSPDVEP